MQNVSKVPRKALLNARLGTEVLITQRRKGSVAFSTAWLEDHRVVLARGVGKVNLAREDGVETLRG